ncbi:hypothetical protein M3M38_07290 [Fructilactobacillus cliffordii]|uniref:hypothetical protein n=1 Tax=Fructilactobacillus cliffordii TaxID=2940299 RepID=UPI002093DEE3|nr:hypothetical protein [Fructilactobacillus cliffordii]USS86463.1 hypothetical protein M3M38_07290 [Fructilactobacillus cliffordii]
MAVITLEDVFFFISGLIIGAMAFAGYLDWRKHPESLFEDDDDIIKEAKKRGEL